MVQLVNNAVPMDYSHLNPLVSAESVSQWLEAVPQPIALTGGTGFVGSHLVETLCAAGITPRVLVRNPAEPRWIGDSPVDWIEGDLEDLGALGELIAGAGTVLHLAGVVRAGREAEFDHGNRRGTANVIRALDEAAPTARLVHVSSLAAAGPSPDPSGIGPEVEPAPISFYGRSKLAAELEVRSREADAWWTIVRPPAIYGPRDTDVLEFFRMANRGIVALPSGERWLTVAWVGDVVRSIATLCEAGGVEARVLRVPPALVSGAGAVGSVLQRLGWRRLALTADKTRELLARHWSARTVESMHALGVDGVMPFGEGAATAWTWYRDRGWLR